MKKHFAFQQRDVAINNYVSAMNHYLILHYGFEKPTFEEISAWNSCFESKAEIQVDRGGLRGGRKITQSETEGLSFRNDSLSGYTIIKSASLEKAVEIAKDCPLVSSTCVYEINR